VLDDGLELVGTLDVGVELLGILDVGIELVGILEDGTELLGELELVVFSLMFLTKILNPLKDDSILPKLLFITFSDVSIIQVLPKSVLEDGIELLGAEVQAACEDLPVWLL
jgi:hypothetical protein